MKFKPKLSALLVALAMTSVTLAGCNKTSNNGSSSADSGSTSAQTEKFVVNIAANEEYTISGLDSEGYVEGATVNFAVTLAHPEDKAINQVTAAAGTTAVAVTAGENGYSFTMPAHDVNVTIALKNIDKYVLSYTGTANADETITLDLKLGNAPVAADFVIEGKTDADKAKIFVDNDNATLLEAGEVTIVAKIGNEVKAELTITVGQSAIMSIQSALDAAIAEAPFNGNNGKTAAMSSPKTIAGKVLTVSSFNKGAVQAIIDDGTAAVVVQLAKAETDPDPVEIGDVIRVTTVFTNYYGLLEGISKGAVSGTSGNANNIPKSDIIFIHRDFTPTLAAAEDITAAQYDTYYAECAANGVKLADDATTDTRTWSKIKYVNIDVTFDKVADDGSILYNIDGSTKDIDIKATHDEGESLDQVAGHKSTLTGFLLGINSSKNKSNMIVMGQDPLAVESITFEEGEETTIYLNNPFELVYTTAPEGSFGDATWASSDPSKVTVENGVVTGLEAGSSTITVTINGVSKSINVIVSSDQHVCESLELNKESLSMPRGTEETLVAAIAPDNCTDRVRWSSSDSSVASVDQNGKVVAVANGTATITVTCGSLSDTCEVTVRDQKISDLAHAKAGDAVDLYGYIAGKYPVDNVYGLWIADGAAGVAVNVKPSADMAVGKIVHVVGEVSVSHYYRDGSPVYTGAKEIAPNEQDGITIVENYEGLAAPTTYELTEAAVEGINEADLGRKATVTGKVTAHSGSGNNNHTITLAVGEQSFKVYAQKSSMGDVSEFDEAAVGTTATFTGFISCYKNSNATFDFATLAKGDYQLVNPTKDNVVVPAATGLALNKTSADVKQGATLQLEVSATPEGSVLPGAVTWSVEGNDKVTVSQTGLVTVAEDAVAKSTATVKATCGNLPEATCVITVKSAAAQVNDESITFSQLNLENGVQYTEPFEGEDFTITFAGGDNDGKYYTTGSGIRTYGGGSFTIASTRNILKIELTWSGSNKPDAASVASVGTYDPSTGVWTGSATSIVFTRPSGTGHWRLQAVHVYYVLQA